LTEHIQAKPCVSIQDWERSVLSAGLDWLVGTANCLHQTVGLRLRQTALDIWCLGRVLRREKELVGHGNWIDHCRRLHPEISLDSIERYMRIGQIPVDQLPTILAKTPRQAYLMFGLVKKRPSLPTYPVEPEGDIVNSSHMRNFKGSWKSALIKCPHCNGTIEFWRKGDYFIVGPKLIDQ